MTKRNGSPWVGAMINKTLHQIWITHPSVPPMAVPDRYHAFLRAWRALHPAWEIHLWGNELFEKYKDNLMLQRMLADTLIDEAKLTNLLRFIILRDYGGLYADIDVDPFKAFDPLTELPTTAVLGVMAQCDRGYAWVDPSVCLFAKDHPALSRIIDVYFNWTYAPRCAVLMNWLTDELDSTYTILGYKAFFAHERHPEAYCLHWPHRLASWRNFNS